MHWQKPTPKPFFLLCFTNRIFTIYPGWNVPFSHIQPRVRNGNKQESAQSLCMVRRGQFCWRLWCQQLMGPRGTVPAGFWAQSRHSSHTPGTILMSDRSWHSLIHARAPGQCPWQPGVRSLVATIPSTLRVLILGDFPFLAVVSHYILIWSIALDKIFMGIFLHSKKGRESNNHFCSAAW